MPQVDFYVIAQAGEPGLLRVACRVTEKAWSQGLSVVVLTPDERLAQHMDEALWTFRDDAFVPHERWPGAAAPAARVLIACDTNVPAVPDVLVNLGAPAPEWHARCGRVAEVVGGDPALRARGRERYRAYRDAGLELRTHEV